MFRKISGKGRPPLKSITQLFHGIEVIAYDQACEAARMLAGRRFLSEEAPRLPLEQCSKTRDCRCVYRHFRDRRTEARREADLGLPVRVYAHERRSRAAGRRITD